MKRKSLSPFLLIYIPIFFETLILFIPDLPRYVRAPLSGIALFSFLYLFISKKRTIYIYTTSCRKIFKKYLVVERVFLYYLAFYMIVNIFFVLPSILVYVYWLLLGGMVGAGFFTLMAGNVLEKKSFYITEKLLENKSSNIGEQPSENMPSYMEEKLPEKKPS